MIENTKLFFFGVCIYIYIYITYQIKKCVYNKKACVYVYVGGCFNKYINTATWPPQIKISGSVPGHGVNEFYFLSSIYHFNNIFNSLINSYKLFYFIN